MKAKIKKSDVVILLTGVLFMFLSIQQYSYVKQQENQIRVRFDRTAMNAEQLDSYYRQQKDMESDSRKNTVESPDVTLWNRLPVPVSLESEEVFQADGFTMIEGYGDLGRIMPGRLVEGVYPPKGDIDGCAISTAGARAVFGSSDVIGMTVTAGEGEYRIRGIADSDDSLLWVQNPEAEGFSNIEMYYSMRMPVSSAEEWLAQRGLESPAAVLPGSVYVSFNRLFMLLPLWAVFLYLSGAARYKIRLIPQKYRRILFTSVWYVILAILVILGIKYSFRFSLDYIPKQWSDFSFYGDKVDELKKAARSIADLEPFEGDRILTGASSKCAYFAWAGLALAVIFCERRRKEWNK